MPNFLVEEITVRDGGESAVLTLGMSARRHLLLTLCISHVMERQNLDVDILSSADGVVWSPVASFVQKFCCGTYEMIAPGGGAEFIKAVWRVSRWGRSSDLPLCRFCISVAEAQHLPLVTRAMAGAA